MSELHVLRVYAFILQRNIFIITYAVKIKFYENLKQNIAKSFISNKFQLLFFKPDGNHRFKPFFKNIILKAFSS